MINLGSTYNLTILSKTKEGYSSEFEGKKILIQERSAAELLQKGQRVEVFIYSYKDPCYLGSLKQPKVRLGQFAVLRVAAKTEHGAFLDWGLEKDLFLPFKEQNTSFNVGELLPVFVMEDHITRRLLATMKVSRHFKAVTEQYEAGQQVEAIVYKLGSLGAFCIVDRSFQGLIYRSDIFEDLLPGQRVVTYITKVREDGKLDLSLRQTGKVQRRDDQQVILDSLQEHQGFLPYHDKTDPETIRVQLNMSKKAFKRSIGSLYKVKKIIIEKEGIRLV